MNLWQRMVAVLRPRPGEARVYVPSRQTAE